MATSLPCNTKVYLVLQPKKFYKICDRLSRKREGKGEEQKRITSMKTPFLKVKKKPFRTFGK
jgi:hypothetical protein